MQPQIASSLQKRRARVRGIPRLLKQLPIVGLLRCHMAAEVAASSPRTGQRRQETVGPSFSSPAAKVTGRREDRSRATVHSSAHDVPDEGKLQVRRLTEFSYSMGLLNSLLPPAVSITQLLTSPIVAHFSHMPCKLISHD